MDFNINKEDSAVGIPYQDITWYDIQGQPFGIGSRFNAFIFGDANNIVDTKGAMAVGGGYFSPRGLTVALEKEMYSPYHVKFLVGGNVSMSKPLVVGGHVVAGGNFSVGSGSSYLIGKSNSPDQENQLQDLYRANGGSIYWKPSDKGNHYLISSYDIPRYIPAVGIVANLPLFFQNARDSIFNYKNCIEALEVNGSVIDNFHEYILRGNDPNQNIFLIDARPNGILNKGLRAEVPEGSLVIVRLRTGVNAHMQYGVWGEKNLANHTLYVFEDANNIYMEKSADIWGSILSPQAMFHAHSTGGHVSGNVALGSFAVNPNSGFEFHLFPFIGGLRCQMISPDFISTPVAPLVEEMPGEIIEPVQPAPIPIVLPDEVEVCPPCPAPIPCPQTRVHREYVAVPVEVPCPQPRIKSGIILGFVWACECCRCQKWEVILYLLNDDGKIPLHKEIINSYGCFKFTVPYKGDYLLSVRSCSQRRNKCKPFISLKNVGVSNFSIDS